MALPVPRPVILSHALSALFLFALTQISHPLSAFSPGSSFIPLAHALLLAAIPALLLAWKRRRGGTSLGIEEWFGGMLGGLEEGAGGWRSGALEAVVGGGLDCLALAGVVAALRGLEGKEALVLLSLALPICLIQLSSPLAAAPPLFVLSALLLFLSSFGLTLAGSAPGVSISSTGRSSAIAWLAAAVLARVALVKLSGPIGGKWQGLASGSRNLRLLVNVLVSAAFCFIGGRISRQKPDATVGHAAQVGMVILVAALGAFSAVLGSNDTSAAGYARLPQSGTATPLPTSTSPSRAGSRSGSPERTSAATNEDAQGQLGAQRMVVAGPLQTAAVFALLFCFTQDKASSLRLALLYAVQAVIAHVLLGVAATSAPTITLTAPGLPAEDKRAVGLASFVDQDAPVWPAGGSDISLSAPVKRLIAVLSLAPLLLWSGQEIHVVMGRWATAPHDLSVKGPRWTADADYELAISYYNEPVEGVLDTISNVKRTLPPGATTKVTLYHKGPEGVTREGLQHMMNEIDADEVLALPNVGREGETYLQHIVRHHSNPAAPLARQTYFLQPHLAWFDVAKPRLEMVHSSTGFISFGPYLNATCKSDGSEVDSHGQSHPRIGQIYSSFLGEFCPPQFLITWAGQFLVSRQRITNTPLATYRNLLDFFDVAKGEGAEKGWIWDEGWWNNEPSNPTLGHALERAWPVIFNCTSADIAHRCGPTDQGPWCECRDD